MKKECDALTCEQSNLDMKYTGRMISKEESNLLKGFAILMVMTGHFVPQFLPFSEIYVPIKRALGQIGVELFLMITGYGIMTSYMFFKVEPSHFLFRRLLKIWPFYFIVISIYYLISNSVFNDQISFFNYLVHCAWLQVFFNVQNDIYSASHYFSVLLVIYVIATGSLIVNRYFQCDVLFVVGIVLFHVVSFLFGHSVYFPDYLASFSFGLFIASYFKNGKSALSLIFFIPVLFCFVDSYTLLKFYLGCCFFLIFLYSRKIFVKLPLIRIILLWLGANSYVLYLGHNYFTWKWPEILSISEGLASAGMIIFPCTIIWLFILIKINEFLSILLIEPILKTIRL